MVAIEGHVYALVLNGEIQHLLTKETLPEWNERDIQAVDITAIDPQPRVGWTFNGGVFFAPQELVVDFQALKIWRQANISKDCESAILAGFDSPALGAAHHYPSNDRDQVNLSGTIQKSLLPSAGASDVYLFLCADSAGVWTYRAHTAAQIQQVGSDAYNAILTARVKNATLQAQIEAATTQAELDAVVW